MGVKVTNNAYGTISAGISSSDTTITLDSGQGARFPTLGASDYFYGTLVDTSNNIEVVKVTARSTDSMTVTRGQDNTTALAFSIGDRFELRPTAALFDDYQTQIDAIVTDVVSDTTPQLGGDLDLNSNDITGTGNIDITGDIDITGTCTATSFSGDGSSLTGVSTSEVAVAAFSPVTTNSSGGNWNLGSITLPSSGLWIVSYQARFGFQNHAGYHRIALSTSSSVSNVFTQYRMVCERVTSYGGSANIPSNHMWYIDVATGNTSGKTIYIIANQSGSATSAFFQDDANGQTGVICWKLNESTTSGTGVTSVIGGF